MQTIRFALLGPLVGAVLSGPVSRADAPRGFIRGDANADGHINIADGSTINSYIQGTGTLPCLDAADVNNSSENSNTPPNSSDTQYLYNYIFSGGPAPPEPTLPSPPDPDGCGMDNLANPNPGSLGCATHKYCTDGGGDPIKVPTGLLSFEDFEIPPGGRGMARVLLSNPGSTQTMDLQGFYIAVDSPPELELVDINIVGTLSEALGPPDLIVAKVATSRSGRLAVVMDFSDPPHVVKTLPLGPQPIPIGNFFYTCKEPPAAPAPAVQHKISFGLEKSGEDKEGLFPVVLPLVDDGNIHMPDRGEDGTATCLPVPPSPFMRGDANGDGLLNIADPVTIIMYLVGAGNLTCRDAADANNDGFIKTPDVSYLLNYSLLGGPAPPQPFPGCGADTGVFLGCKADDFCGA